LDCNSLLHWGFDKVSKKNSKHVFDLVTSRRILYISPKK
jgi:hypothetical protein